MLNKKLQDFSRMINDFTRIPLFEEIPSNELHSLTIAVSSEDSLRARVTDLCNILDRINKRALDQFTSVATEGSRECLTCLLKKLLPNDHIMIDQKFGEPIGMILLFRAYFTHRKNRNIKKALEFFNVEFPINDHGQTWEKILVRFSESIDFCLEMLNRKATMVNFKQDEIDGQLMTILQERLIEKYRGMLEEANIKRILLYIMSEGLIIDSELAESFQMDLADIRALLLPLAPNIVKVSYYNSETTSIKINEAILKPLRELYFGELVG